ncbi:hypothetical protein G6F35_018213 [Rhizopus arrhizus]|nr:hypothetical protein G6F35_018213 [Rhizopus arrhizus]
MPLDTWKPWAPVRDTTVLPEPWRLWIIPWARRRSVASRITAALTPYCSARMRPGGSLAPTGCTPSAMSVAIWRATCSVRVRVLVNMDRL